MQPRYEDRILFLKEFTKQLVLSSRPEGESLAIAEAKPKKPETQLPEKVEKKEELKPETETQPPAPAGMQVKIPGISFIPQVPELRN